MAHAAVLPVSLVALVALAVSSPAFAQVRAPTPQPAPQPGIVAPDFDPSSQAHSTILLRLDAVEQSVRRQIVVLEYSQDSVGVSNRYPIASSSASNNANRVTAHCSQALGDRFGRVVSYERTTFGEYYFFNRIVCETQ